MSDEWTPTGRWRHVSRRAWKKEILVLQIEELIHFDRTPDSITGKDMSRWRDAVTGDLTVNLEPPGLVERTP